MTKLDLQGSNDLIGSFEIIIAYSGRNLDFREVKYFLFMEILRKKWCPEVESNHRHKDFQSFALPTELSGHLKMMNYN